MIETVWPTHILHTNIDDNYYCEELFQYLISTYSDVWPNSFAQKDIFTDPEHKNPLFTRANIFIKQNVSTMFGQTFGCFPKHFIKAFATNHQNIGIHQHQGSLLSGVFYVYCNSGEIRFHDPRVNAQRGYPNELQRYFSPKTYKPKTGDLLLFPSFLQHEVSNNLSKEPRVIMPFDVFGDQEDFGQIEQK